VGSVVQASRTAEEELKCRCTGRYTLASLAVCACKQHIGTSTHPHCESGTTFHGKWRK